jgi:hypothetical protein
MADVSIQGRLRDEDSGKPARGLPVEAWDTGHLFPQPLGTDTSNADGAFQIPLNDAARRRLVARKAQVYFRVLRDGTVLADTSDTVHWDPVEPQPVVVPVRLGQVEPSELFDVHGSVVTDRGTFVEGLRVEVWDKQLMGEQLLEAGTTGPDGRYSVGYDSGKLVGKRLGDIQVRVFDLGTSGNGSPKELARSKVTYQAPDSHEVDLVVPFGSLPPTTEHDSLVEAMQPLVADTPIAEVGPDGVVFLANRGGFDPRTVAMAVQASRASAATGIPADHYYALFRAGAANDLLSAHRLTDTRLVSAIESAVESGVISDANPVDRTLEIHKVQARAAFRTFVPTGGMSTLDDLLSLRLDDAGKDLFIDQLRATKDQPEALWDALAQAGMEPALIAKLQVDGKLGHLTLQNVPLMRRLVEGERAEATADLVTAGLYEPDTWLPLIGADVPQGLTAETYAAGLAAQVRFSHPQLVTADLVRRGQVELGEAGVSAQVADFLVASDSQHRIGAEPIRTWSGFDALEAPARQAALRLERLYQITPSNGAMATLSRLGFDSAQRVARVTEAEFLARFGEEFANPREAALAHRKAQQVHGTILNTAVDYLVQRGGPRVYALAGRDGQQGLAAGEEVPGKATLETLFGNLDYCACDHCKSVLSPAAYFVDLLEMLDLHDVPHAGDDPQTVLFERRPDLANLLLTCENTNVAMPYVDLVNEVLEHYVAHGSLAGYSGHDTSPSAENADLLVDPQFVEAAAYPPLAAAVFPVPLPFHLPLEALRLQYEAWDTTLADAFGVLGTAADVRRETLGLNPAELSILTDHTFRALPEHFGEPAGATIDQLNSAVANAKVFSRRLGLAYFDLDAILKTRFVSPGVVLLPLLEALGVGLATIQSWFDGDLTDQQLTDQFPADLDPAPYGGDVLAWLTANRALIMGMVVLAPAADADPEGDCDFGDLELRLSLPDPDANALTESEYTKLCRFVRLWRRLGWEIPATDELLARLAPALGAQPSPADLDAAFVTALARIANFQRILREVSAAPKQRADWLALFDPAVAVATRRAGLARLLRLGAVDFESLAALTGVDPLTMDLQADTPSLLRFLAAFQAARAAPLKVADLDWLVRHQDPGGGKTPSGPARMRELRALRDALTGVDQLLGAASVADPASTQATMGLVYDPAVVGRFFGLLGGSTSYSAPFATSEEILPAKLTAVAPGLGFDPFAKRLTNVGILPATTRDALHAAADSLVLADMDEIDTQGELDAYVAAFKVAATALHDAGVADRDGFVAEYPELGAVLDAALDGADPSERAAIVRDGVLPELRARLKTTALRAALTNLLKADETVVGALTAGPGVLHANADATKGVLADLTGMEKPLALDHNQVAELWLDPQVSDEHILYVRAPQGTVVRLRVDGSVAIASAPVGPGGEVSSAVPLALTVETPVRLELTVASLPAGATVTVLWRTKGIAKTAIPADRLTPAAAAAQASASMLRLHKAAMVAQALGLTARELTFLASTCPDTSGFLDALPTDDTIAASAARTLYIKLARIVRFVAFRSGTESDPDTWVDLLERSALGTAEGQARAAATGSWRAADVTDAMAFLAVPAAALRALDTLAALARVLDLAVLTNQSVADLRAWTLSDPGADDLAALRDALRAQLDAAAWRATMQSINDVLRNRRRDALVAYILTHAKPATGIDTADELYEHFLLDVEMDACMQTSRMRLALSTVQLFVTRCLMNLEDRVPPSSIRADHWQWMKRYRVWEANRKIFLYPENWLEPELRDGKSSFFDELEADLLKSDITDQLAEDAFLAYLKKLDDVARLEIVGMHLQQGVPGKHEDDILHVFGRTNGKTRQYYYRRFEYGYWTAWERVGLNIEGDTVFPAIWKNQLYLFWLTAVPKPRRGSQDTSTLPLANQTWQPRSTIDVELTFSWGEYYRGKWTSPKSTNMARPLVIKGLSEFHPEDLVLAGRTEKPPEVSERLVLSLIYYHMGDLKAFKLTFTSKNSAPIVREDDADLTLLSAVDVFYYRLLWDRQAESTLDSTSLDVPRFDLMLRVGQPSNALSPTVDETLFTKKLGQPGFNLRPLMHPVENQWEAPFVYADEHSTFLATPDERVFNFSIVVDYVPIPLDPVKIDIPALLEQVKVVNPRDPIWDPPWTRLVDTNFKNVIGEDMSFELDGVQFGALGLKG